jgi:hypothetical protein
MANPVASAQASFDNPARDFFAGLGRRVAAPLLIGMLQWMAGKIQESKPDMILFLSRDGDILRKLWELRCPSDLAGIPTRYLLASRRALWMASLQKVDDASCRLMTSQAAGLSVRQLFQRVGLDEAAFLPVLSRDPELAPDLPYSKRLESAVHRSFKELEPELLRSASRERKSYSSYLESEGITLRSRLAIVDIGWHGSLQIALANILRARGKHIESDGYYCGVFPDAIVRQSKQDRFHGFLLQGEEPSGRFRELQPFVELIEFLFSSPDKSLINFEESESGIQVPVFGTESPSSYQLKALQTMHEECLKLAASESSSTPEPYHDLMRLGLFPSREEAALLAPLEAARGFGDVRFLQSFACTRSRIGNLLRWSRFYKDFKNSLWRPGYWACLSTTERRLLKILSPEGTKDLKV